MQTHFLLGLLGASVAASQSTAVDTCLLYAKRGDYVGSVVDVSNDRTTMVVNCAQNNSSDSACRWPYDGATYVQEDTSLSVEYSTSRAVGGESIAATCSLDFAGDEAGCVASAVTTVASTSFVQAVNAHFIGLQKVTITAGAEKLKAATTKTTDPSGTPTETKSQGSSSTDDNAAPMVTGNAALAGAAAIVGMLAL